MIFRKCVSISLFFFLALTLAGCSSDESATTAESGSSMAESPQMPASSNEGSERDDMSTDMASTSEPEPAAVEETSMEAEAQPMAHGDGLPEGLGKDEFERICSECHAVDTALTTRRSQAEWGVVIQSMRDMGANASNIEAGMILAYLSQNFGT